MHSEVISNWSMIQSQKHYLEIMQNILFAILLQDLIHYSKIYNRIPELNPKHHTEIKET